MRARITDYIGLSLLALCFAVSLGRIVFGSRNTSGAFGSGVTLRLSHWQLEGGVREAFDKIAADYNHLHPNVHVVQIPIPERIYQNWLTTQFVGGTVPDLVQIEPANNAYTDKLARYCRPLSEFAGAVNPYNRDTDLAGLKVRDTLIDGMEGGFNTTLLEYYGLPISGGAIRIFYNLDLLAKVTGRQDMPHTLSELTHLCQQAQDYRGAGGQRLIPIVGSKSNGPLLMKALFGSQTQKLMTRLNSPGNFLVTPSELESKYWQGAFNLRSPEIVSGLQLMRDLGQYMQPGFMQVQRDDALFYFLQGNALMITTGSWDAISIHQQADFRVGAAPIPFPAPDDAQYGRFTTGAPSEAGKNAGVIFALPRVSPHPAEATDFLYFLASKRINQLWTDTSGWVPAVVHVKPAPLAAAFQPILTGSTAGFELSFSGSESGRIVENAQNILFAPDGNPQRYLDVVAKGYDDAVALDVNRSLVNARGTARRTDTQLGALAWQSQAADASAAVALRQDRFLQSACSAELKMQTTRDALENAGKLKKP